MGSGMGAPDDEMNRRQELQQRRIAQMDEGTAVAGSSPDCDGDVSTADASADEMLAQYKQDNGDTTMTKEKKKLKSPRYSDVPAYTLEVLDMDTLRDEVFQALDFNESERQAAGAIAKNDVSDMTQAEIADLAGVSASTVGNTIQKLETRKNPTSNQRETLKFARENPEMSVTEIARELDMKTTNVKRTLIPYRHERIVCEVEVPEQQDDEETQGETTVDDEQDDSGGDDGDAQSDEADAVQKDLEDDDEVTYKYDPKDKSKKQTRGGQSLKKVRDQSHLISLFRELDRRLRELEDSGVETDVPSSFKGRVSSLESQLEGMQSVVDRIENQQSNLERFVEQELEEVANEVSTPPGLNDLEGDVRDLEEDVEDLQATVSEGAWGAEELSLESKVERIEESLSSHKEAIQELREKDTGGSTSLSTEEKRKIVVALAENGQDDLSDRVLEEF